MLVGLAQPFTPSTHLRECTAVDVRDAGHVVLANGVEHFPQPLGVALESLALLLEEKGYGWLEEEAAVGAGTAP